MDPDDLQVTAETSKVLYQIAEERQRQDQKWGGPANDDQLDALDWHEMIADYNAWARRMAAMGSLDKARNRYVQLAAIAVAAVEAIDRRQNACRLPRHDDELGA